jgi:hypothetical protein
MSWFCRVAKAAKGKHIRFRGSDSSHNCHYHLSDWQEHSVPLDFDPQGDVFMGSSQDMSTSSEHYYWSESEERTRFLTSETQIILRTNQERRLFQQLKDREFAHIKVCDNTLLNETGLIWEFGAAFDAIGWGNFWHAWEEGSKFLTLEFLSTLSVDSSGVKYRLFSEEHDLTWEQLSIALGFDSNCLLEWSKHKGMKAFSRESFWKKISGRGLLPGST